MEIKNSRKTEKATRSGSRRADESFVAYENRKALARAAKAERRRRHQAELIDEIAERAARNLNENRRNPIYDKPLAVDSAIPTKLLRTGLAKDIRARLVERYPGGFSKPKRRAPDPESPLRALKKAKAFRAVKPQAISRSNPFAHIREMDLGEYQRITPALSGGRAAGLTRTEAMLPAKARATLHELGLAPSVQQQIHEQTVTARVHHEAQVTIPAGAVDVLGNLVSPPIPVKSAHQRRPDGIRVSLSKLVPLAK